MLKNIIPDILAHIESNRSNLVIDRKLFDIYEGNLLKYVEEALSTQLSSQPYREAKERIPAINILKKVTTKLSNLYSTIPTRDPSNEKDADLVKKYTKSMSLDSHMHDANTFFNLHNRCALEPYIENGEPKIRSIPAHQFLVYSDDRVNPTRPTVFIKFMGSKENKDIFWLYTDKEFLAIDSEGDIVKEDMVDNPTGVNPIGKIPFVYINRSRYKLIPNPDSDMLRMTLLIPILLADLNFAAKYQTFSIIYGIDVDTENLEMNPSALWNFKSDPESTGSKIGTIKPSADTDKMIDSITTQLAMWFETRNLRGATISGFSNGRYGQNDSSSSGIALLIQNLDTSEDRKVQTQYFTEAESNLWSLITKYLHPYWVENNKINETKGFTTDEINTFYSPEYEIKSDKDLVEEIQMKMNMGLISRKLALRQLYPNMKEAQLQELLRDIELDETIGLPNQEVSNEDLGLPPKTNQ